LSLRYAVQEAPRGIAEALLIGQEHVGGDRVALILGDNLFYGQGLSQMLRGAVQREEGATIFAHRVEDPSRYGVVELSMTGEVVSIEEKPSCPRSMLAITGLYLYDRSAIEVASTLVPSARGELEISDVNREYLRRGQLHVDVMGRGMAWLDAGTPDSLQDASRFIEAVEKRQGLKVACPEEVAWRMGFIDREALGRLARPLGGLAYGRYLLELAEQDNP
jgi:glucose-1-phosphate thymidylyltransferase